jgi:predicted TIM-barrel fold metal-dependent hydrolase
MKASQILGLIAALPLVAGAADAAKKAGTINWHADPEWVETRYGDWGGPGVTPVPGPMDGITVKDYAPKSSLILPIHKIEKARFPAIDIHSHTSPAPTPAEIDAWVRTMDDVGIEVSVVLTSATGPRFDALAESFLKRYPTRFQLYCGVLTTDIDRPDYPERAAAELERCFRKGARGVGELTDKGWGYTFPQMLPRDKRLHPDDARLDQFWDKCAELKIPAVLHQSDHPSAWKPLDVYQERSPDFQQYSQYGKDVPSYEELIAARDRLLAKHPKTTFIACHLGNQGHDLATLSKVLDRFPNLYLDIAARDYEVGRTPRAAAKFLSRYSDRLLFGTDMGHEKRMYQAWWRLFETADEDMPGRVGWRYSGLDLPAPLLEALYRNNARRLMNWQ